MLSKTNPIQTNRAGGGGSRSSVSVDEGIESTLAYPPPQHDPSNGERSLALKNITIIEKYRHLNIHENIFIQLICKIMHINNDFLGLIIFLFLIIFLLTQRFIYSFTSLFQFPVSQHERLISCIVCHFLSSNSLHRYTAFLRIGYTYLIFIVFKLQNKNELLCIKTRKILLNKKKKLFKYK